MLRNLPNVFGMSSGLRNVHWRLPESNPASSGEPGYGLTRALRYVLSTATPQIRGAKALTLFLIPLPFALETPISCRVQSVDMLIVAGRFTEIVEPRWRAGRCPAQFPWNTTSNLLVRCEDAISVSDTPDAIGRRSCTCRFPARNRPHLGNRLLAHNPGTPHLQQRTDIVR